MNPRKLDPKAEAIRAAWQREVNTAARAILASGYGSHKQADAQALIMRQAEDHGADVIAWAVHCSAGAAVEESEQATVGGNGLPDASEWVDIVEGVLGPDVPATEQIAWLAEIIEGLAATVARKASGQ